MTLTKSYEYNDNDYDTLVVSAPSSEEYTAYISPVNNGVYVKAENAAALALNVLGHNRPVDKEVSTLRFQIGESVAHVANSQPARNDQVNLAAALLTAVDAFDQRAVRLATAESRREAAARRLTDAVSRLRNDGQSAFTGDEIGKLREALGRFDAELVN